MRILSEILNNYQSVKTKDIIEKLNGYQYVSFDVYDTLIKRVVRKPTDLFEAVRLAALDEHGLNHSSFQRDRIIAESRARGKKHPKDITLSEIYACLDGYDQGDKDMLMALEEKLELECSVANAQIRPIYDWCLKNGRKILILSDMYLSRVFIERMLRDKGFTGYQALYVSSDDGRMKDSGALFDKAMKEWEIKPREMIHIGDTIRGDYIQPRSKGIKAIKIARNAKRNEWVTDKLTKKIGTLGYDCLSQMIGVTYEKPEGEELADYFRFGYETFGMLLFGFSKWVLEDLKKNGIDRVFFLARDGYIMKRAFDRIAKNSGVRSCYLYASRRSLRVPQLWSNMDFEQMFDGMPTLEQVSVEGILRFWGLEADQYLREMNEAGLKRDARFNKKQMLDDPRIGKLYEIIQGDIRENSKSEYTMLIRYLEQMGFVGKAAIVDIGWEGNMQKYMTQIKRLSNMPVDIHGYYMCLAAGANEKKTKYSMNMKGYIFDSSVTIDSNGSEKSFVGLFETLFLAQEGSTKKYEMGTDKAVSPVLFDYEYHNDAGVLQEERIVKTLQAGALDFIEKIGAFSIFSHFLYPSKVLFCALQTIGRYPSKKALELFADFRFMDHEIRYIARPRRWREYLIHPKRLWSDFLDSTWKAGFIKRLMKTNLLYPRLLYLLVDARSAHQKKRETDAD